MLKKKTAKKILMANTNGIQSGFFGQKRFFSWEDLKKYFEKID
jgi:hypothetical protein